MTTTALIDELIVVSDDNGADIEFWSPDGGDVVTIETAGPRDTAFEVGLLRAWLASLLEEVTA